MIGRRTNVDVVNVAILLIFKSRLANLAFEIQIVAVFVLMLYQITWPFTLVLAFLSVRVDMVTLVVVHLEVRVVHVVLHLIRPVACVVTSHILTLVFVDLRLNWC